jgi:zinc protease
MFLISATARSGRTLGEIERVIQEEVDRLKAEPPARREVDRAVNQYEAGFLDRLENVGGFGGKADQLNWYYVQTGNPDYFNEDLARYRAVDPQDISTAAMTTLVNDRRVVLSVVPKGKQSLASGPAKEVKPQ